MITMKGLNEMQSSEAERIYKTAKKENIAEDLILHLEGLNEQEYKQALKLYLKTLPKTENIYDSDDKAYREFQQANYDEYFDWAGTYRYALYK